MLTCSTKNIQRHCTKTLYIPVSWAMNGIYLDLNMTLFCKCIVYFSKTFYVPGNMQTFNRPIKKYQTATIRDLGFIQCSLSNIYNYIYFWYQLSCFPSHFYCI